LSFPRTDKTRFSVSQLMLRESSFEDDVEACAALGIGLGVSEAKLGTGRDDELRALMAASSVSAAVCVPAVIGPLKDAWRGGPDDPRERTRLVCDAVDRLAGFGPQVFLVVTGAKALYPVHEARRIIVAGLREIAEAAARHDLTVGVEVLRDEMNGSLFNDLPRTFELLDEVGADNLGVVFDVWHLWDAPGVLGQIETYAPRISAVQIADWRAETRWSGDRVLPGHGLADLPALLHALETNGFTGVYDLEVFSDQTKPDSIWQDRDLDGVLRESWHGFVEAWDKAGLS
jgi:sugar phosphate isomerase/epimerase